MLVMRARIPAATQEIDLSCSGFVHNLVRLLRENVQGTTRTVVPTSVPTCAGTEHIEKVEDFCPQRHNFNDHNPYTCLILTYVKLLITQVEQPLFD